MEGAPSNRQSTDGRQQQQHTNSRQLITERRPQMPRLQATVPPGAPPNALLRVRLPDGTEVKVRVPEGLRAGDEFQFEVSSLGEIKAVNSPASATTAGGLAGGNKKKNPKKKKHHDHTPKNTQVEKNSNRTPLFVSVCLDLYQKLVQALTVENQEDYTDVTTNNGNANHGGGRGSQRNTAQSSTAQSATAAANTEAMNMANYLGFLDKDIVNGSDFCTALAVRMFIGLSIVLGFLAGVLWVTPVMETGRS